MLELRIEYLVIRIAHEKSPGRHHFYSCDGHARHPGDGFDHPGPAETDSRFSRRTNDERDGLEHLVHVGFRPDAVFLLADSWRLVRSDRPAPDHLAFKSWPWTRLHCDGARAVH